MYNMYNIYIYRDSYIGDIGPVLFHQIPTLPRILLKQTLNRGTLEFFFWLLPVGRSP